MEEREDYLKRLREHDERNFNSIWGDKEPDVILEAIKLTRQAYEEHLPINELADKLGERFLIVPGRNEPGTDQLSALINGYMVNPEGWNAILDGQTETK